jgi:rhamnosyltransferase
MEHDDPSGGPAGEATAITAVIVTYEPDDARLIQVLSAIRPQVSRVVVVDNASTRALPTVALQDATLIRMPRNVGIGAAQNAGIRAAQAEPTRYILLLDQDSIPAADMVRALLDGYNEASKTCLVGAVGPCIKDGAGRHEGFVRFRSGRYTAVQAAASERWIDCDLLIASGALIPAAAIKAIGGMAEDLFIDKVDTEWCLRAAAKGYRLVGAPRAVLHHALGEAAIRVWLGQWRELRQHKPFRYYYMVRNGLLLRRSPYRTRAWCRADMRQLLSLFIYFGALAPRRGAALRMLLRGLVDGLCKTTGPLR